MVESQESSPVDWKYTQNWIAYEIGLACALRKDVWVLCDGVTINFPVPYLNNYCPGMIDVAGSGFEVAMLSLYQEGRSFPLNTWGRGIRCRNCGAEFNLHMTVPKGMSIVCPTCLGVIELEEDWLVPPIVGYRPRRLEK